MDTRLNEFIHSCVEKLKQESNNLKSIKEEIEDYFEEKVFPVLDVRNTPTLQARVKGTSSLREKVIRKRYFKEYTNADDFIKGLPDIIGVRLVCLLNDDERTLFQELERIFSEALGDGFFCIPNAGESGSSYVKMKLVNQPEKQKNNEDIYRITCAWVNAIDGYETKVEIQIKSLVHMFWGEMEHMLFYKNYQYMVGADFYSEMMSTINNLMKGIDEQLNGMQKQLQSKDDFSQIEEMKQMIAKFMYDNYQPQIDQLLECQIDCREVYDALVFVELKAISVENSLRTASHLISRISSDVLNASHFQFDEETFGYMGSPEAKLANTFWELAKSQDVFWRILLGLYNLHHEGTNTSIRNIKEIATNLFEGLLSFQESLDFTMDGTSVLFVGMQDGIVDAFNAYQKLDFFLPKGKQKGIINILNDFVQQYQDQFEEITTTSPGPIQNLVKMLISLEIRSYLSLPLSTHDFQSLQAAVEQELEWLPEYLNRKKLKEIVEKQEVLVGFDEIKSLLTLGEDA